MLEFNPPVLQTETICKMSFDLFLFVTFLYIFFRFGGALRKEPYKVFLKISQVSQENTCVGISI